MVSEAATMPKKKRAVEWPKPKGRVKVLEPNDSRFPETLASLVAVDERCYEPRHRNLAALAQSAALRRSTGLVAAWDQEGTCVGFLTYTPGSMAVEVTKVAVDPNVRRGGFGRYMLWTAVNAAKAGGASEVRLRVECTNAGAVKMYEQQGFVVDVGRGVDGISFDFYGPTRHATNMVLNVEGDNWVLPRVLGP